MIEPVTPLPRDLLLKLNARLSSLIGINFSSDRLGDLHRHLKAIAKDFEFKNVEDCIQWLIQHDLTEQQLAVLASHLTIGETYFFREPALFDLLETHILPDLIALRRKTRRYLNIWSAGCASGEEPYTLAIILSRLLPDWAEWSIKIYATDLNHHFLARAKIGRYTKWSMRSCPCQLISAYFNKQGDNSFIFEPSLRPMVQFQKLNLAKFDDYRSLFDPGSIDIILCRNVFIYFAEATALQVTGKMSEFLTGEGLLFVSPNELFAVSEEKYRKVSYPGGTYFLKDHVQPKEKKAKVPSSVSYLEHRKSAAVAKPVPVVKPSLSGSPAGLPLFPFATTEIRQKEDSATDLDAKFARAQLFFAQSSWQEAVLLLLSLYEARYKLAAVTAMLTRAYANRNWLIEALAWSTIAIENDKLNASLYYLRATILEAREETVEAITCLRQSLFLDPESVLAHFAEANLLIKIGQQTKAKKHLKTAQKLLLDYEDDDLIPDSDGMTAGALKLIINSVSRICQ